MLIPVLPGHRSEIYVHIDIYEYTYIYHIYTYIYIYTHTHICIYMYMYHMYNIYINTCMYRQSLIPVLPGHHSEIYIHNSIQVYIHI